MKTNKVTLKVWNTDHDYRTGNTSLVDFNDFDAAYRAIPFDAHAAEIFDKETGETLFSSKE